jgi:hypothetical protein
MVGICQQAHPAWAGLKILNIWMPVPLYLSGVVIIFAFLDLAKNFSFSDSLLGYYKSPKRSIIEHSNIT